MRMNRIFCEGPLAGGTEIAPARRRRLSRRARPAHARGRAAERVRRQRPGISRRDHPGRRRRGHRQPRRADRPARPSRRCKITLVQGVSRSERMDWTLQKATELGVAAIAPVLTARSVVRLDEKQAQKKQAHWRGIVIGACEQCGRAEDPAVSRADDAARVLRERAQGRPAAGAEPVRPGLAGRPVEPAQQGRSC